MPPKFPVEPLNSAFRVAQLRHGNEFAGMYLSKFFRPLVEIFGFERECVCARFQLHTGAGCHGLWIEYERAWAEPAYAYYEFIYYQFDVLLALAAEWCLLIKLLTMAYKNGPRQ